MFESFRMPKRWLVTVHDAHYPSGGSADWRKTFNDGEYEAAKVCRLLALDMRTL